MKIVQISDLHIDSNFSVNDCIDVIDTLTNKIREYIGTNEPVCIICCGDIVNKGDKKVYNRAIDFWEKIMAILGDDSQNVFIVPGNHDLCDGSFHPFQRFSKKYQSDVDFTANNVIKCEFKTLDIVLINTTFHKEYDYGRIDFDALERTLSNCNKSILIVMHHTLMSRFEDDHSSLVNGYRLMGSCEKYNIIGIVHGHTHSYSNILIGDNCRVIGVGSLFAYFKNCNNQFNIIDIQNDRIEEVINYRYHADLEKLLPSTLYRCPYKFYFEGRSISQLYSQVKNEVKTRGGIINLTIRCASGIIEFLEDMKTNFENEIRLASNWLAETTPNDLYYNHGSYMSYHGKSGIDYVADELLRNSTSNRAIIPLINLKDMKEKQFSYIPGLISVQFGFTGEDKSELYCSMHLRSLEVAHFLKINLSEIYLLIENIRTKIRSIKQVNIQIFTFRAQYKEKFSCFQKAKIDMITSGDISNYIYTNKISEIIELLQEKFNMEESIVNTYGLKLLYDILSKAPTKDGKLVNGLKEVIELLESLKLFYEHSSDYHQIAQFEANLHNKQQKYLEQWRGIERLI